MLPPSLELPPNLQPCAVRKPSTTLRPTAPPGSLAPRQSHCLRCNAPLPCSQHTHACARTQLPLYTHRACTLVHAHTCTDPQGCAHACTPCKGSTVSACCLHQGCATHACAHRWAPYIRAYAPLPAPPPSHPGYTERCQAHTQPGARSHTHKPHGLTPLRTRALAGRDMGFPLPFPSINSLPGSQWAHT